MNVETESIEKRGNRQHCSHVPMGWGVISLLLGCCLMMAPRTGVAKGENRIYALVIGNNHSLDREFEPLRFADDDAVKYYELLRAAGAEVALLTVLDPDAQRRFPDAATVALPPRRVDVLSQVDRLYEQIKSDRQAGVTTHFFFVYSGHGNIGANREGYINFLDVKFYRSELYRTILSRSPASYNHLILDACHAYHFVKKRGVKPDKRGNYRRLVKEFLRSEELNRYPNTGVILAASSTSETHEWSRWESGIFSHELRSALLGAADVDGDGGVTYAEAAACVEAANSAIDIPLARLRVFYHPPAQRIDLHLMDLSLLESAKRIHFDSTQAGRYHVEDARGIRIADFHFSNEQPISMALVGTSPFYLRTADEELIIDGELSERQVHRSEFTERAANTRGSVERSFRQFLYRLPFGSGFYRGMRAVHLRDESQVLVASTSGDASPRPKPKPPATVGPAPKTPTIDLKSSTSPSRPLDTWGWISLGSGLAAGVAAGFVYYSSTTAYDDYKESTTAADARKLRSTVENRLLTSRIMAIAGSALALTGGALLLYDFSLKKKPAPPAVQPSLSWTGDSFLMGMRGSW